MKHLKKLPYKRILSFTLAALLLFNVPLTSFATDVNVGAGQSTSVDIESAAVSDGTESKSLADDAGDDEENSSKSTEEPAGESGANNDSSEVIPGQTETSGTTGSSDEISGTTAGKSDGANLDNSAIGGSDDNAGSDNTENGADSGNSGSSENGGENPDTPDAPVTHITCKVDADGTATVTLDPQKDTYTAQEEVTVYVDLEDGYDLNRVEGKFGEDDLTLQEQETEDHDAAFLFSVPEFDADTVQDIEIIAYTEEAFPGYALETEVTNASVSYDVTQGKIGSTVNVEITADEGYVIPDGTEKVTVIVRKGDDNLQTITFTDVNASSDFKTRKISFEVPDLGKDEEIKIYTHVEAVKRYAVKAVYLESDSSRPQDILSSVKITPTVLYEGVKVTISGIPSDYNEIVAYPVGQTTPVTAVTRSGSNAVFTMPDYDIELICEKSEPPLTIDPNDVYTPNTNYTFNEKSNIPNEPDMQVIKAADWTNIQAGEAQVTISEKDLNQYTNLPCDYIIMVDCSQTMDSKDNGSRKTRYQLANDAIRQLLSKIDQDNASLNDEMKSRVAFMTYSGSIDNGKHPTKAKYNTKYYAGDSDYFYAGVYEYNGFTTDTSQISSKLNNNIRKGSKINQALDMTLDLLEAKGLNTKRQTKVINISDCGNDWSGKMREGYFTGNYYYNWKGITSSTPITADDKVEYIKNHYGAYFMQICIGPSKYTSNITRTSVSEASGDHLFWTYDGSESRFNEIFTQIHDIPFKIEAVNKQIVDVFDTTYWDIVGITSCTTGMNTVSLSGNKLVWNVPNGNAEKSQTCKVKIKLKDQYRYQATSDTSYRTNADGSTPGLTYTFTIDGGIYDKAKRSGGVNTPYLKYGTVEFKGNKNWTVTGSYAPSIITALYQTLPGMSESAIETITMTQPNWTYAYTNAARRQAGKYPYIKYNNKGQTVSYTVKETVPKWYKELTKKVTSGATTTINFYNEPYKIKAKITKVDEETGNPLKGAVFQVYQWSTETGKWVPYKGVTSGTVSGTSYEAGNMNGSSSIMQMTEQAGGVYVTPSWLYYTSDNGGRFAVVEAKAPTGYFGDWQNDALVTDSSTDSDKIFHEIQIAESGSNSGSVVDISNQSNGKFGDQRVLGQLSFTKTDLESGLPYPQGDATFEGATYKLYAAEDIVHADGTTGVLYKKGEEIKLHQAGTGIDINVYTYAAKNSGESSIITIPKGGSVMIKNLELGKYYLQEVDSSEGYLIQPDKYSFELAYAGENTAVVKENNLTVYEKVKKQRLSFYKVTGYGNQDQVVPLEGAKFSVYRVEDLNGGKYADYTDEQVVQAMIDDYRDAKTLLYESIKQESPARVYAEDGAADVASGALVKSVTYSTGEKHKITENRAYLVDELSSNEKGIVTIPELPYGRYVVIETTTPKDKIATRPFVYSVVADDEHGTTNSVADTNGTPLNNMVFLVDHPISSLIRIEKVDSRDNLVVLKPGAKYLIHDLDGKWFDYAMQEKTTAEKEAYKQKYGDLVVQYAQGTHIGTKENPYTTQAIAGAENALKSTYIDTVDVLPAGNYELEEVEAPDGYILNGKEGVIRKTDGKTFYETEENGTWTPTPQTRTRFSVSSEYAVYDQDAGKFVMEVRQLNDPAIGKVAVYAEGEKLVSASQEGSTIATRLAGKMESFFNTIKGMFGFDVPDEQGLTEAELETYKNYTFQYEIRPIEGARFEIRAAEDIYAAEYDEAAREVLAAAGTPVEPLYHAGDVVETLTTNADGQAWTGTTDYPGTDTAKGLPVGKYTIVQTKAGDGFVLSPENAQPRDIDIAYAGQEVPVIYRDSSYVNPRQTLSIDVDKTDKDTGDQLSGAIFGLYAGEDIKTADGKVAVKAGTVVAIAETSVNDAGEVVKAAFDADLPLAKYYVKEIRAPYGYVKNPAKYDVDATYKVENQTVATQEFHLNCANMLSMVQINLMDYYTEVELDGAQLQVRDQEGNEFTTVISKHNDNTVIRGLQPGESYILKELVARDGYHYKLYIKDGFTPADPDAVECEKRLLGGNNTDSLEFDVADIENLQTVSVFNKPLVGDLTISKTGEVPVNPEATDLVVSEANADGTITNVNTKKVDFTYEEKGLPGAEYALRAAEDIVYPDGYTGVIFHKGDLVLDVYEELKDAGLLKNYTIGIKDATGEEKDVSAYKGNVPGADLTGDELSQYYTDHANEIERQFPSEAEVTAGEKSFVGTAVSHTLATNRDGKVALSGLPLGAYEVAEVQAPAGYYRAVSDAIQDVDLTVPEDQSGRAEAVLESSVDYKNTRQQPGDGLTPETSGDGVYVTKYAVDGEEKEPKAGAEFTLYAAEDIKNIYGDVIIPAGQVAEQAVSGADGIARFSTHLPVGKYVIKETDAPKGYYRTSKKIAVDLEKWKYNDGVLYLSGTSYVENPITVINISLIDDLSKNEISGGHLKIEDKDGNPVDAWITEGSDGYTIKGLDPEEEYRITETLPRDGYLLNITDVTVTSDENLETSGKTSDGITIKLKDVVTKPGSDGHLDPDTVPDTSRIILANPYVVGNITVNKSGEFLDNWTIVDKIKSLIKSIFGYEKNEIGDVEFTVYAAEDIEHPDGVQGVMYHAGDVVETGVRSAAASAIAKTDATGAVTFKEMYLGKYYVKETSIPDGFVADDSEKHFTLAYVDGYTSPVEAVEGDVDWINERQKVHVEITKHDVENPDKVLEGAVFALYNKEAIVNHAGDVLVEPDTMLETSETGEDGVAVFESDLPLGMYYAKEIQAPDGYTSNAEIVEIDASYDVQEKEIVVKKDFYNEITKIFVDKFAADTDAPLKDATMAIVKGDQIIDSWVTDGTTHLTEGLLVGEEYAIRELEPADGYTVAEDVPFTVEDRDPDTGVYDGQTYKIVDEITRVEIMKTDADTKEPVNGSTITVYDTNGKKAAELKTVDGKAVFEKLKVGSYTYKETAAPETYALNPETKNFTIARNGDVTGDTQLTDEKVKIRIHKVNPKKEALEGAEFTLYNAADEKNLVPMETIASDQNGDLVFEGIKNGVYVIKETKSAKGYRLTKQEIALTITPTYENEDVYEIENRKAKKHKHDVIEEETTTPAAPVETSTVPGAKTGDTTNALPFVGLLLVSAAGIWVVMLRRKRRNSQ